MHGVYLHETKVKTSRLIKTFISKLEALGYIEELVEEYITKKDGETRANEKIILEPSSFKSSRWGSLPYGHFKTRNTEDSLYKTTVWNKIKNAGYLYNTYEINKIFTLDLILLPKNIIDIGEPDNEDKIDSITYYFHDHYDDILAEELDIAFDLNKQKHIKIMTSEILPLLKTDLKKFIKEKEEIKTPISKPLISFKYEDEGSFISELSLESEMDWDTCDSCSNSCSDCDDSTSSDDSDDWDDSDSSEQKTEWSEEPIISTDEYVSSEAVKELMKCITPPSLWNSV